jgi:hypothetical protein
MWLSTFPLTTLRVRLWLLVLCLAVNMVWKLLPYASLGRPQVNGERVSQAALAAQLCISGAS